MRNHLLNPTLDQAAERARIANAMNAFAHPKRVLIYQTLRAEKHGLAYGDLLEKTGLTIATLNHHLRMMRSARAVASRRRGANVIYRLTPKALAPHFTRMAAELDLVA